ncbi:MAG: 50S ribosomal protein L20 [Planctomycetota bacterium]|jgi:large subunit ribosomal protein L20|nr:50S ribosomal protein L20 [Phycisphaerae bacterium]
MPRVRKGAAARQAKKRVLKAVKGYRGAVRTQIRLAKEARLRAEVNARVGRRLKKRDYRSLWIIRLSAACKQRGMRYSQFISGCKKAGIELNRKMLSEIAIADEAGFDQIVEQVKAAL